LLERSYSRSALERKEAKMVRIKLKIEKKPPTLTASHNTLLQASVKTLNANAETMGRQAGKPSA
jgi:hypothetical protein